MKKAWKIVLVIILIILLLGAVCVGVGFFTGADSSRIYKVLDEEYKFADTYNTILEKAQEYTNLLKSSEIYFQ